MANQSAFDLVAGGKVLVPTFTTSGTASGNVNLAGAVEQLGSSTMNMGAAGNVYLFAQPSTAALSPAGTGAEYVVAALNIITPGFDVGGRGLTVTVGGSFGGNGNANKLIRVIWNPTGAAAVGGTVGVGAGGVVAATTGAAAWNGSAFSLATNIYKYGISGSNTQVIVPGQVLIGSVDVALVAPTTATANEGASIPLVITAQSGAAGVTGLTTDVLISYIQVEAFN
jgi:hypothetical protein